MIEQMFRLGRLGGLSAVVATMATTVLAVNASAAGTPKPDSCPTDKPLVVNGYATYENSADYGADGHIWALDAATRTIRVGRLGKDDYCVEVHDIGTSTTYAGLSPEGTGTVRAGVTASFVGSISYRVHGKFAPTVPTHNFIGDFDAQCNQEGTCTGRLLEDSLFFSSIDHIDFGSFSFSADAGACGTWSQTDSGDTGDIVCP
jgi:hypothetical protein